MDLQPFCVPSSDDVCNDCALLHYFEFESVRRLLKKQNQQDLHVKHRFCNVFTVWDLRYFYILNISKYKLIASPIQIVTIVTIVKTVTR